MMLFSGQSGSNDACRQQQKGKFMPDPTPTPTPEKPKVKRGLVNKKYTDALNKTRDLTVVARKADYKDQLAESEIDDAFVTQLETDVTDAAKRIAKAGDLTSDLRVATAAEVKAQAALLTAIKGVQAAAKQKFSRTTPQQMKDYFVGEDIDSSRKRVLLVADNIAAKLATESLPGMKPAKVTNLKTLRDAYFSAGDGQGDTQSKASKERDAIEAAVQSITDRRIQIQFAADGIWQSDNKSNAPIRHEFQLPPNRPFSG
jgi:hypothetical protein